jgi:adenosine deaminase
MKKDEFYSFLRKIPKAEIHLHAEATISRQTVQAFIDRKPESKTHPVDVDKLFSYNSLKEFLTSFIFVQGLYEEPGDLTVLFDDVALYLKENNIVYCELFFSPSTFIKKGFTFPEMLDTIQAAITTIEKRDGLKINLIIDVSRSFGVENAQANLDSTLKYRTPMVIGVGLGGDEETGPAKMFGDVFRIAASRGLHVVAHAGEVVGPESIWDALKTLKVERIGHGLSAIQDPELVRYLAEKQIPVEICLTSNIFTQKYVVRAEDHPVRPLYDQGVLVVVNTDDPTFFHCTIIDEFWSLHSKLKFSMDEIKEIIINGFKASFLKPEQRAQYIAQVESSWAAANQERLQLLKK